MVTINYYNYVYYFMYMALLGQNEETAASPPLRTRTQLQINWCALIGTQLLYSLYNYPTVSCHVILHVPTSQVESKQHTRLALAQNEEKQRNMNTAKQL